MSSASAKTKQRVLDWFKAHERGTIEQVSLGLKMNPSTAYLAIRNLAEDELIRQGESVSGRDGRGRVCIRFSYLYVDPAELEDTRSTSGIVQKALSSRPLLQVLWGAKC